MKIIVGTGSEVVNNVIKTRQGTREGQDRRCHAGELT